MLNFASNIIECLPETIQWLTSVHTLNAEQVDSLILPNYIQNLLKVIPDNISGLVSLKALDLSHNRLESLPAAVQTWNNNFF